MILFSQNHRMVEVGMELQRSSNPTSLLKQGHLQHVTQDLIQTNSEYLQRRKLHACHHAQGPTGVTDRSLLPHPEACGGLLEGFCCHARGPASSSWRWSTTPSRGPLGAPMVVRRCASVPAGGLPAGVHCCAPGPDGGHQLGSTTMPGGPKGVAGGGAMRSPGTS